MYKIEQKSYGLKLTFAGFIREVEITDWQAEMLPLLKTLPPSFGMLIDMCEMTAMPTKSQEIIMATQKNFKSRVTRSATITKSTITNIQSKRISNKSGVNETKVFIDAALTPDWETQAIDWIENGTPPPSVAP
ncbi:MAG: hypothetical protein ACRBFS_15665 [Aureispira sp.]